MFRNEELNEYIMGDFFSKFAVHFRAVCDENQDATDSGGGLSRQHSITNKWRTESDMTAEILGVIKLSFFNSSGLVRVREFLDLCKRFIFDKQMAPGTDRRW